jgi:hypothetical protein
LSEPALQIVSRTTPFEKRSTPQLELRSCMGNLTMSRHFPAEAATCQAVL